MRRLSSYTDDCVLVVRIAICGSLPCSMYIHLNLLHIISHTQYIHNGARHFMPEHQSRANCRNRCCTCYQLLACKYIQRVEGGGYISTFMEQYRESCNKTDGTQTPIFTIWMRMSTDKLHHQTTKRDGDPPTTQADTAVARSSCLRVASRARGTRAAKIR